MVLRIWEKTVWLLRNIFFFTYCCCVYLLRMLLRVELKYYIDELIYDTNTLRITLRITLRTYVRILICCCCVCYSVFKNV